MKSAYRILLAASVCICLAGRAHAQTVIGPATPVEGTYGTIVANAGAQKPLSADAEKLLGQLVLERTNNPDRYRTTLANLSPEAQALLQQYNQIFSNVLGTISAGTQARNDVINAHLADRDANDPMNGAFPRTVTRVGNSLPLSPASYGPRLSFEGGYFDDDTVTLAGAPARRGNSNGYFASGRLTVDLDPLTHLGVGVTYSRTNSRAAGGRQRARGEFLLGSIYGSTVSPDGSEFDVTIVGGKLNGRTRRDVTVSGNSYSLVAESDPTVLGAELGFAHGLFARDFVMLPRISLRGAHIVFGPTAETGGLPALRYDRYVADSLTSRAGVTFSGTSAVRPWFSGAYVHEFIDRPDGFGANFAVASGPGGQFLLGTQDRDWGELSGGVIFGSDAVALSLGADTIVSRSDVNGATYHGSLAVRF